MAAPSPLLDIPDNLGSFVPNQIQARFAQILVTIGRGPGRARPLTREEACLASALIMTGYVSDVQLGAFYLMMRFRGESATELAGLGQGVRNTILGANTLHRHEHPRKKPLSDVLIDWPSYAGGKNRRHAGFVHAAQSLVQDGSAIFMHGANQHQNASADVEAEIRRQGLPVSHSLEQAEHQLQQYGFSYLPLACIAPPMAALFKMREDIGLRGPAHSFLRHINLFNADLVLTAAFHPAFLELHCGAGREAGHPVASIKGGGGEFERNPRKPGHLYLSGIGKTMVDPYPAFSMEIGDSDDQIDDFTATVYGTTELVRRALYQRPSSMTDPRTGSGPHLRAFQPQP